MTSTASSSTAPTRAPSGTRRRHWWWHFEVPTLALAAALYGAWAALLARGIAGMGAVPAGRLSRAAAFVAAAREHPCDAPSAQVAAPCGGVAAAHLVAAVSVLQPRAQCAPRELPPHAPGARRRERLPLGARVGRLWAGAAVDLHGEPDDRVPRRARAIPPAMEAGAVAISLGCRPGGGMR